MQESYGEGVATHAGPEPCAVARKSGGEALVMGTCRSGIEPRNMWNFGVPTPLLGAEGHVRRVAFARHVWDPARSETPCMHGNTSHGNREIPCPPGARGAAGRTGKSKDTRR